MAPSDAGLVRRTILILRVVAAHPTGIGLSDVARDAGVPKATCYRILGVLERESWVTLDPQTRRYRLSLGLLSIVGGLLDAHGAYGHMQDALRRLSAETQETSGFDVLLPPNVMVVAQVPGPFLIGQTLKPVPRMQPVWATSTGKVLLAFLDQSRVREEFGEAFGDSEGPHPPLDVFLNALATVRQQGFAFAYDELEVGAASVAAPVHVGDATPYAVWIGGPTYRLTRDRIGEVAGQVIDAANALGRLLSVSNATFAHDFYPTNTSTVHP